MPYPVVFSSLAAVALSLGLSACGSSNAAPEGAPKRPTPVRVGTAAPAEFLSQIRTVGRVEPDRTYVLAFKTAGVVSTLNVQEGDTVRKGQVLAELDPRDVNAQLRQAQEAAAKADRELVRIRQLHAKGFASAAELQDAQAQVKSTQAAAQAARSDSACRARTSSSSSCRSAAKRSASHDAFFVSCSADSMRIRSTASP